MGYLSGEEGHGGAVDPGVVPCGGHALQVVLALVRCDASAGQLPVIHYDLVPLHRLLHGNKGIYEGEFHSIHISSPPTHVTTFNYLAAKGIM